MGFLMCIVGCVSLWTAREVLFEDLIYLFSKVLLIIFGAFMIIDPKKNNMRAIGMYAFAIGSGRVLRGITNITSDLDSIFFFGLALIILGGSLVMCGYNYFKGVSKNAYRMTLIAYIILLAYIIMISYYVYNGVDFQEYIRDNYDVVSFLIMYLAYILVLTSPEVTSNMPLQRILYDVNNVWSTSGISGNSTITPFDVSAIMDGLSDAPSWRRIDSGPVESEIQIRFGGDSGAYMILQKWKNKDPIYVTMSADPYGTLIQGSRFLITDIIPENGTVENCDSIRMYGPEGMVARLKVVRPEEKKS